MRIQGVVLALLAGGVLSAQQPAQPVFRAGVELVTVDVVATTGSGAPVHDLKASDFELFEDGVPQPIRTFEFINFSAPPPGRIVPPDVFTNELEPGGIFAVVVDEIGMQVDDVQQVRRVAARFFSESLQPHDHVAVIRSGTDSGFFLTTDRALALETIAASTGRRERTLGVTQPTETTELQESTPTIETFGSGENGRGSFRVLSAVVERLQPIRARRKAIIWFSRGGDLPPNITESFELGRPVGRDDDAFNRLVQAARAANVAIYSVDPRGLQNQAADLSRDINPMDTSPIHDMASFTGGRPIISNDANAMLEKVAAENRAYYLLGYEPSPATGRRPRARKLRVETKAPGVSLLHRSVFLPGEGKAGAAPPLIASPLPVRDLAIMLAPASVAVDRRKRGVVVPFEIGGDLRDGTDVEYMAMALDASGKVTGQAKGRGKAKDGRIGGELQLATSTGGHQIRVAARALNPEISGLAFAAVRVPEGNDKEPSCGGFVFEQPGDKAGVRQYDRERPIAISTLISAQKLGAMEFGLGPAGGIPQKTWKVDLGRELSKGLWRVQLSLNAPLPRGNLEIQMLQDGLLLADNCVANFAIR